MESGFSKDIIIELQNGKKINTVMQNVSDNAISSSLANKNLNQELDEQKQSFLSKINSIEQERPPDKGNDKI